MSRTQLSSALKPILISLAVWCSTIFLTIALFFIMLLVTAVTFPFDKQRKLQHFLCFLWSDILIRINPYWHITIHGREHIDHCRTYVIVANHQSLMDIVMLFQLRIQFKWLAKDSLFRIPFLGWCLSLAKHVRLERGKLSSIRRVNQQASDWIDEGMSMMYFPEGTRCSTGTMQKFRNGAFKLALKKQVAVLPIAIDGTSAAMPKNRFIFNSTGTINIKVLPAIEPKDFVSNGSESLKNAARDIINRALPKT